MAARPLRRPRRGAGGRPPRAGGHHPERHRQGVPLARHVHLPARAQPPADRRHGRLDREERPQVEPHQRVPVPPARGGGHTGAGAGLRARHRRGRARRRARLRSGRARGLPGGRRAHLVLRRCRHPLRRRDVQDAGLHPDVGPHLRRALRRHGSEAPALPLRRAGQLPGSHRGPAREQCPAHRARDARRHPVQGRPGPRHPAAVLERGARAPSSLGPAVVAAHAAGPRL